MIPSPENPLLRPAVQNLFEAEEAARAARRAISPAEKTTEASATVAMKQMTRAMGQLVAAYAELARTFPKAAEGIQP